MIDSEVTVVVPTSAIPSHPSTHILDQVITSIRFHLPTARLLILADAIRPAVAHRAAQYSQYKDRLFERQALGEFELVEFGEHAQQSGMMQAIIDDIKTPLILFVEHDVILVTDTNPRDEEDTGRTDHPEDCVIKWRDIADIIYSGGVNMVRFYLWEKVWWEHQHLMRGQMIENGSRFVQTVQYSQWPNIASTEFYRRLLTEEIPYGSKQMIELAMYGKVVAAPWTNYRIAIYLPEPNGRRFFHLNGRADVDGIRDPADW